MEGSLSRFISVALTREVVLISLRVSLVVGTLLALINHGGAMLDGRMNWERIVQIALTYLVPYGVCTFSAVKAINHRSQRNV